MERGMRGFVLCVSHMCSVQPGGSPPAKPGQSIPIHPRRHEEASHVAPASVPSHIHELRQQHEFDYVQKRVRKTSMDGGQSVSVKKLSLLLVSHFSRPRNDQLISPPWCLRLASQTTCSSLMTPICWIIAWIPPINLLCFLCRPPTPAPLPLRPSQCWMGRMDCSRDPPATIPTPFRPSLHPTRTPTPIIIKSTSR